MKKKVISVVCVVLILSCMAVLLVACDTLTGTYKDSNGNGVVFKNDGTFYYDYISWHGEYEVFDDTTVTMRFYDGAYRWKTETWTLSKNKRQIQDSKGKIYKK